MRTEHKVLARLALRLLSVPCSSASVERQFSITNKTHTTGRSKLSEATVRMVMLVRWHLSLTVTPTTSAESGSSQEEAHESTDEEVETDQTIDSVISYFE